ncbi:hypothetical protein ACLI1A_06315 [Flavobacterium sp. RHBU_3]|uniref:hypothetical protein n=1 Tax=Flavobacterium sp. RHBU_3 TaxID=3391184 RepID=UPI003984CF5E
MSCSDKQPEVRTDAVVLGRLINLPVKPVSVLWVSQKVVENPRVDLGPTDYYINAVIKLDDADFEKVKQQCSTEPYSETQLDKSFMKPWFPQSVKDCFKDKGDYLRVPITWADPKIFIKSPLLQGFCFFTNNNEVFVHLYTM